MGLKQRSRATDQSESAAHRSSNTYSTMALEVS